MTGFENRGDLSFRVRQHDHQRRGAVGGERIALEGRRVFMAKQDRFARQHPLQRGNDVALALLPEGVRLGLGSD